MYRTRLFATALIAAGAAVGYIAASIDLPGSRPASAASPSDGRAIRRERGGGSSQGATNNLLLARVGETAGRAVAQERKPNIVVIMGDDVGSGSTSVPITGA